MTATKPFLLAAILALALGGTALAGDGDQGEPSLAQGRAQVVALSVTRTDVGSEAYPTTAGLGAAEQGLVTSGVVRSAAPAYQRGFDVGAEAYPTPR